MPFSFLNTAFLVGMAAAALPILIHLFSRRKIARVPFSSLQFLEEIARRRVRRMRFTQWLILALRVLALLLLALALGRPAFQGNFSLGKSRGESAVALVLDRSFSMGAEGARTTLWENGLERAKEALAALDPDDQVILIGVDPRVETTEPYPNRHAAEEAVRNAELGFGSTDFAVAVRRAATALAEATALNKELFIVSDFQRSGVGAGAEAGETDLMAELEERVRVFLLPVHEGPIANTVLEVARLEGSTVDQRVHIQVARHGDPAADDVVVTVESGTEVLGESVVSVSPGTRETAQVSLTRLPGEGEEIRTRLALDRLPVDDVRYVPSLGSGQVSTLLVQDPAQPSPFLPLAMSPTGEGGRFEISKVPPIALNSIDLSTVRLVVLDNVTMLSREAVMRLRNWRAGGGAVFISLGERVDLRHYNESILPAIFPGAQLENLLGTDEATGLSYSLTPRASGHEAFSGFEAEVGKPLTGAAFWRVVAVRNGPDALTLAEFGPGLPALLQGERALLFASSLDGKWNNFPAHSSFVPLLHQALDAVLKEGDDGSRLVGDPVAGFVDRSAIPTGTDIMGFGPDGLILEAEIRPAPRGVELRTEAAPAPGFYTIRAGDRVLVRSAVNLDTAESDLTPLTDDELLAMFPRDGVQILPASVSLGSPIREARYGREFWRELVVLVLLIMLAEGWLSRRGVA